MATEKKLKMNVNKLRAVLVEEIEKLRDEKTTPGNVNAVVNATGKILSTIKIEMEYAKINGRVPKIDFMDG